MPQKRNARHAIQIKLDRAWRRDPKRQLENNKKTRRAVARRFVRESVPGGTRGLRRARQQRHPGVHGRPKRRHGRRHGANSGAVSLLQKPVARGGGETNPDGDKLTQGIVPPGSSLGFDSDAAWLFTRDTDVAMGDCLIAGAAQPLDFMNDLLVGGATLGALAAQSRLGDAHPMSAAQTQSAQTQVAFVKSHAETEFARNVAINDEWVRSVAKMCEGPLGKARCATLWLSKESRGTFKHPEAAVDQQEYYAGVAARLDRAAWRLNHPAEHILFLDKLAAASRANQKGADKALPAEPGPSFDELFARRLEQAKAMRAKSMQAASE